MIILSININKTKDGRWHPTDYASFIHPDIRVSVPAICRAILSFEIGPEDSIEAKKWRRVAVKQIATMFKDSHCGPL